MQPVITLFKSELLSFSDLCEALGVLAHQVEDCEFFYLYRPTPARLPELLKYFKENKVNHGVHFENAKGVSQKTRRRTVYEDQGVFA